MKSSVLAIGTELTIGQIINRNASFISGRLKKMGALSSLHLTVPDDKKLILEGLDFCANHSDFIFVTGGLGPTTDDFTRDMISEWTGCPLKFETSAWDHIVDRLTARNYPVQDIQKQQCYFPEGARILTNSQGTAHGFFLEAKNKKIWVLPGPPREIESIWSDHVDPQLKLILSGLDKNITVSWDTLGLGESQIAEKVEPVVQNQGFEIGYRVHLPYVEVKLSYFESEKNKALPVIQALDNVLSPLTLCRNDVDLWVQIQNLIPQDWTVLIQDAVTGSFLFHRISAGNKNFLKRGFIFEISDKGPFQTQIPSTPSVDLKLELRPESEFKVLIKIALQQKDGSGICVEKSIEAPMKSPLMLERRQQYWSEMALVFLKQTLTSEHFLSIYKES